MTFGFLIERFDLFLKFAAPQIAQRFDLALAALIALLGAALFLYMSGAVVPALYRAGASGANAVERIFRILVVPRGGIEPPTPAFSVQCSTN